MSVLSPKHKIPYAGFSTQTVTAKGYDYRLLSMILDIRMYDLHVHVNSAENNNESSLKEGIGESWNAQLVFVLIVEWRPV